VVGLGSAVLLVRDDPFSAQNRRISITVLNQRAEKRILEDAPDVTTTDAAGTAAAVDAASAPVTPPASPAAGAVAPAPPSVPSGDANAVPAHLQPPAGAAPPQASSAPAK
jgi:chemotaxis protein MotB